MFMLICRYLGCHLDVRQPLKTWFNVAGSSEKVYIILDACHMLKLFRNLLESYRNIRSPSGTISWHFISDLNDIQQQLGLKLGNKLSPKHVSFHNLKMKVSLAAQTLSQSVASALRFLKENASPGSQFSGVLPTVEFIEVINRLFDIFNSCNPRAPGFKKPINNNNFHEICLTLNSINNYLLTLKNMDGIPLYECKR